MHVTYTVMEEKSRRKKSRKVIQLSPFRKMWKTIIVINIRWLVLARKSGVSFNALNMKHNALIPWRKVDRPTPHPVSQITRPKNRPIGSPSTSALKTCSLHDPFSFIPLTLVAILHSFHIFFSISMHQICDGYNPRVRMGNSPFRQAIGLKRVTLCRSQLAIAPRRKHAQLR